MLTLAKKAEAYFRDYVRGGGKANRKKQVTRIVAFLDWVESTEKVMSLHCLGKRHVIDFWRAHRDLSDETRYKYWLGISELWRWLDKHEDPPEPYKGRRLKDPKLITTGEPTPAYFTEESSAIKAARELHKLTIQQLANMTGIETTLIERIENGEINSLFPDRQILFRALNIKYSIQTIQ